MTRATICSPKQRLLRMHGDDTILSITRGGDWTIALLALSLIGISIVILALGGGWRPFRKSPYDLKCLQLKVVDYQSGKFEITGFTGQFLAALRSHQGND